MNKWEIYQSVPPECWKEESSPSGGDRLWILPPEWIHEYYRQAYAQIIRNGDPFVPWWSISIFTRPDLSYECTIYSRRAGTNEYYDFVLTPADNGKVKTISRFKAGTQVGSATCFYSAEATKWVRITSTEVDEDFQINLQTLAAVVGESRQDKERKLLPWKRLLFWFSKLQSLDPQTYAKVPWPIQNFLRPGFDAAVAGLTWQQVEAWQNQGLLPKEMAWIWERDLQPARESIQFQKQLASDPHRQVNPMYIPQIPYLLRCVDPSRLELLDVQVFMTIGAVREAYGYREREMHKLFQRRPDLQALNQSPEGQSRIQQDREVQMINSHPLSLKQQEDEYEVMQHRNGNQGPTPKQMLMAQERQMNAQMQAMMASMNADTQFMQGMLGSMGVQMPMSPLPPMPMSNPLLQEEPPPPWMVYRPYLI